MSDDECDVSDPKYLDATCELARRLSDNGGPPAYALYQAVLRMRREIDRLKHGLTSPPAADRARAVSTAELARILSDLSAQPAMGPWIDKTKVIVVAPRAGGDSILANVTGGSAVAGDIEPADAAFIASASPDVVLAMVKRIRELEAEVAQLKMDLNEARAIDYVMPARFVVDAETAERIADAIQNPREPNDALRALLKKERTNG